MTDPITDPCGDRANRPLYEGTAQGGPLELQALVSRFPRGLVAVDKAAGKAWVYDYQPGETGPGVFVVRDPAGEQLDDEKRWAAADGADFEVVAV